MCMHIVYGVQTSVLTKSLRIHIDMIYASLQYFSRWVTVHDIW